METETVVKKTAPAAPKKNDQMGLSECAAYDWDRKLKDVVTGWGKICKARHESGNSRKQRKLRRLAKGA